MCFHSAACALRHEFQREAAWYGIAFFHIHPSWVDTWEDDAIVKKLLRLKWMFTIHRDPGSQEY